MIVAAAIRTADGRLYALARPSRHADVIGLIVRSTKSPVRNEEQGFLACSMCHHKDGPCAAGQVPHGFFVRRAPAETIARQAGQITKPIIGGVLTSEDLW